MSEIGWSACGAEGVVAAGKPEAVAAGIGVLKSGGNAVDAAVATLLALSVTDYGLFAIGGEVALMFYSAKTQKVKVLSGLGGAPLSPKAIDWYMEYGIGHGGIKTAPVPAALDLCITALKLYGTLSFESAVTPTLALIPCVQEEWSPNLALTMLKLIETESQITGSREVKLTAVRDRFYKGDMADVLDRYYTRNNSFLRKADLEAHTTRVEEPVAVRYGDYTVYKCGSWTQGPTLCQALRLLKGYNLKEMGFLSPDYIHVLVEALKLALADRDEYYADPLFAEVPIEALISDEYTNLRQELIDIEHASSDIMPGDPFIPTARKESHRGESWKGGTTTCVVSDRWGNVVAATPSANGPYSVCEELGISHGTRLSSLNTAPYHPNCIAPGKRPRITLTPTIAVSDNGSVLAMSVAGGDRQDQTSLNCFLNVVEFGMTPAKAVTAPRFATGHHQDSFRPDANRELTVVARTSLTASAAISDEVVTELRKRGHQVTSTPDPIAAPVMLLQDAQTGQTQAAGDPRAGRHASAVE